MGKPSIGQTHQVMSIFSNNIDWTKTDSELLQQFVDDPKWAGRMFFDFVSQKRKNLKLLKSDIQISTKVFSTLVLLNSKWGVEVYLGDKFKDWIVPELSEEIPDFSINLASYKLTKNMYDKEIRAEIGENNTYTPDEAMAIIFANIYKQPHGEDGDFENRGLSNIQYVRLKSGDVVVVVARWDTGACRWCLRSYLLDDDDWNEGNYVFVRSLPTQVG
jgi:hypothetical protein